MTHLSVSQYQEPPFAAEVGWQDQAEAAQRDNWLPGQAIPMDDLADVHEFLCRELFVPKLNDIHKHLWLAGWRGNLHPLHWHIMVRRNIVVTEDPNMHLVCTDWAIFVKPLPLCLLDHKVYCRHVAVHDGVAAAARGMLLTYAHLVTHESDFALAVQHGLLPRKMPWIAWCHLRKQLVKIPKATTNERYQYGELRLNRLNLIYRFGRGRLMYFRLHRSYTAYFCNQYKASLILFAYVTIVQSALQTMLTSGEVTPGVAGTARAAVYFGALTVGFVVVSVVVQALYLLIVFLCNLGATLKQPDLKTE
ncbi:hypothetical protein C8R45DRAFT_1040916 [Mycena sanguinolenta]|nr:hypothetical protein C8R45DRAFT_1040916 [Mycena sanguinolenta]